MPCCVYAARCMCLFLSTLRQRPFRDAGFLGVLAEVDPLAEIIFCWGFRSSGCRLSCLRRCCQCCCVGRVHSVIVKAINWWRKKTKIRQRWAIASERANVQCIVRIGFCFFHERPCSTLRIFCVPENSRRKYEEFSVREGRGESIRQHSSPGGGWPHLQHWGLQRSIRPASRQGPAEARTTAIPIAWLEYSGN